ATENQVRPRLQAPQPALFGQLIAEPAEPIRCVIITETTGGDCQPFIGEARRVTVAPLQADTGAATRNQGCKVGVGGEGRRGELVENAQRGERGPVGQERKIDQILERPTAKLRSNPVVLSFRVLVARMRRPIDAYMPQVVETQTNGAVTLS